MTGWYLSRAKLRPDLAARELARALLGDDRDASVAAGHRLIWTLFGDDPDRRRDFLWRQETPEARAETRFYLLSTRPPEDRLGLFELDPPKPFAPELRPGDRLRFSLRANPVVTRKDAAGRACRHDVVMDALQRRGIAGGARAEHRWPVLQEAGRAWLESQGERNGFSLVVEGEGRPALRVDGYAQRVIPRERARPALFSVVDFEGVLEVGDPDRFLPALTRGFGKAKAWGCGLMLIRRA